MLAGIFGDIEFPGSKAVFAGSLSGRCRFSIRHCLVVLSLDSHQNRSKSSRVMSLRKRHHGLAISACAIIACLLLALAGCHVPRFPYLPRVMPSDKKYSLRHLDGISLEDQSTVPPVQLKQALDDHTELLPEPKPPKRLPSVETNSDATNTKGQVSSPEELPAPPAKIELSLAEARASALTSNLELAVERVNPEIARQQVSAETARFEATFTSTWELNRVDPPPGIAAGGLPDTQFQRFHNALTQPLLCGGDITGLHDVTRATLENVAGQPVTVDTDLGFQYRQPLLRGFGVSVNTTQIRIAQTNAGIADSQSKLTAIRVLADVERAYWQLYAARKLHDITVQQLELANQQADVARRLVKAEVFTKVEELVADSGVLIRKDATIRAETNVHIAERDLKRIMQKPDAPVNSATELALITDPTPVGLVFDRKDIANRALGNRMELLQLQLQLLATQIDANFQRNGLLPRLDLRAQADALGQDHSYRTSMDNLFEGDFSNNLIGLALEVPLAGNVGARARLREAQLRGMQTVIQSHQVSVVIEQEVYDAIERVEQNWQRIIAARQATLASQQAYEGQVKLQEAGRQTVTDVLVALTNLGDARTQEVQAIVDYQIAKVDLALATGAMLGYGQVDWNPCCGPQSPLPDLSPREPHAIDATTSPTAALKLPAEMLLTTPNAPAAARPSPQVVLPVTAGK
jgi:outer membrane protein TolC